MSIKRINQGTIYEGWEGDKYCTWSSDQELKKLLLDDLKHHGIKATIRFRRGGISTAFVLTVNMPKSYLIPFDTWKLTYRYRPVNGSYFWKVNDQWQMLEVERFDMLTKKEQEEIIESCKLSLYFDSVEEMKSGSSNSNRYNDLLTEDGQKMMQTAQYIVDSYNHDGGSIQTDYFDRSIYDNYAIKLMEGK